MAAKMLSTVLVALTLSVFAAMGASPDCTKMVGVKSFSIKNLCGKTYHTSWTTNPWRADCIVNTVTCNTDDTVTIIIKFYVKGELNDTLKVIAKDSGPGRVTRTLPDVAGSTPVTQVFLSYSEYPYGQMKYSSVFCRSGEKDPFVNVIGANFARPDLLDEINNMKNLYPVGADLSMLDTTCPAY